MLASGEQVLVLDFSGQPETLAAGLMEIAGDAAPHPNITLPDADVPLYLLHGLTPEEMADLFAAAVGVCATTPTVRRTDRLRHPVPRDPTLDEPPTRPGLGRR